MKKKSFWIISTLRWLSVPLVIVGVAAGCAACARWFVNLADERCRDMVGGACVESWHTDVVEWSIYVGVVVAFLLMTILSAWVAPSLKRAVSIVVGVLGVLVLIVGRLMTGWDVMLLPVLVGAVSALVGIMIVWRRRAKSV